MNYVYVGILAQYIALYTQTHPCVGCVCMCVFLCVTSGRVRVCVCVALHRTFVLLQRAASVHCGIVCVLRWGMMHNA